MDGGHRIQRTGPNCQRACLRECSPDAITFPPWVRQEKKTGSAVFALPVLLFGLVFESGGPVYMKDRTFRLPLLGGGPQIAQWLSKSTGYIDTGTGLTKSNVCHIIVNRRPGSTVFGEDWIKSNER